MTARQEDQLDPFVVEVGDGQKDIAANLLMRRLASAEQTGGEFSIVEMSGVRGTGARPHWHGNEAEAFYITDGSIRVRVGDIETVSNAGDFIYIPKYAPHMFTIESARGALLCLATPAGFEEFYTQVGRPTTDIYPPNPPFSEGLGPKNFMEIAERFNWHRVEEW